MEVNNRVIVHPQRQEEQLKDVAEWIEQELPLAWVWAPMLTSQ